MDTTPTSYEKVLSANDTGITGGHMGGILIPRTTLGLIALFPELDPNEYNPSAFINIHDINGKVHNVRFVYYNNKLHKRGTRNEYRLTHLTDYLRIWNAKTGDLFRITKTTNGCLEMCIVKQSAASSRRIVLRGWNPVC
jgi:hypothetical protein